MTSNPLDPERLDRLRQLDSCSVANAIETFDVRLRNTGFTDSTVRCIYENLPPLVGYAATLRIRASEPPMEGESYYYRLDWLEHVMRVPEPRVLVVQDLDRHPGLGSFIGNVHATVLRALGCIGVVTNGAVRHVREVEALQFQMFAGNVSVSHAYSHVFDFGVPVEVGQMHVQPGNLLHGDLHGVQTVPLEIAHKVPDVARRMNEQERELMKFCQSADFTVEKFRAEVNDLRMKRRASRMNQ
jgi:regulator of RNase E activity RraA